MEQFLQQLQTIPETAELIRRVEEGGCPAAVSGLQPVQRACVGAAVARGTGRPAVFVCGDEREVRQLSGDLRTLMEQEPVQLLAREWQFRPGAVSSREWERSRLAALYALARGQAPVVVTTADALMARTLPPQTLLEMSVTIRAGERTDLQSLSQTLLSAGYTRCDQVEGVGQFALRGGILDVFSPLMEQPVRCEFFDDEIDSMGTFDPGTQRRTANVDSALLLPAARLPHPQALLPTAVPSPRQTVLPPPALPSLLSLPQRGIPPRPDPTSRLRPPRTPPALQMPPQSAASEVVRSRLFLPAASFPSPAQALQLP